jgi:hypothetical protein
MRFDTRPTPAACKARTSNGRASMSFLVLPGGYVMERKTRFAVGAEGSACPPGPVAARTEEPGRHAGLFADFGRRVRYRP